MPEARPPTSPPTEKPQANGPSGSAPATAPRPAVRAVPPRAERARPAPTAPVPVPVKPVPAPVPPRPAPAAEPATAKPAPAAPVKPAPSPAPRGERHLALNVSPGFVAALLALPGLALVVQFFYVYAPSAPQSVRVAVPWVLATSGLVFGLFAFRVLMKARAWIALGAGLLAAILGGLLLFVDVKANLTHAFPRSWIPPFYGLLATLVVGVPALRALLAHPDDRKRREATAAGVALFVALAYGITAAIVLALGGKP